MESQLPPPSAPLYPEVVDSNPQLLSPFLASSSSAKPSLYPTIHSPPPPPPTATAPSFSSSLYPSIDTSDLVENLFPEIVRDNAASEGENKSATLPPPVEETLIRVPGAILHLIDRHRSVELGAGDFSLVRLRQGDNTVAVLARIGDDLVQWPLARDEAAVKLDESHYFFSLHVPDSFVGDADRDDDDDRNNLVNYGLTFASKGQDGILKELDKFLQAYSSFSVEKVKVKGKNPAAMDVLDGSVAREVSPAEGMGPKKQMLEEQSVAYWTTLAPNVEDYSSSMARLIAKGSGQVIKGILWCGEVTVDRLMWGEDLLKTRMDPTTNPMEISNDAMKRMKRVKRITKMSEKVANGVLSGVVKVSGFFTSSFVNSKAGKKLFGLLPGEVALASLDGFGKICDAIETSGKNVLQTSSDVTTGLVSHRYGDQAAEITHDGLSAAGHAFGTAWAVFKIRKALNPKSVMKPTTLSKSAIKASATDLKAKMRR